MRAARTTWMLAAGAVALGATTPAAAQDGPPPRCGAVNADTGEVTRAALTPIPNRTDPAISFGRDTGTGNLTLVFAVADCQMAQGPVRGVDLEIEGNRGPGRDLQADDLTLRSATMVGPVLRVVVAATTEKINPGAYSGSVFLSGQQLGDNSTQVSVSRSESSALVPIGWGAVAGLAGLFWAFATRRATKDKIQTTPWLYALAAVASAAAGAFAAWGIYQDQEVWTVDANLKATLPVAFAASTTGAAAVILTVLGRADPPDPPDPPKATDRDQRVQAGAASDRATDPARGER